VWGNIYRTTNGGDNWALCGSIGPSAGNSLSGVHFGEPGTGFAVGSNGIIMCSTNGGVNWTGQSTAITNSLNSVYMLNALTGYVCGSNGIILKTTNGGVTGFKSKEKFRIGFILSKLSKSFNFYKINYNCK
jgi:photosystem II stability/assembly factor-like uncharacterized protein